MALALLLPPLLALPLLLAPLLALALLLAALLLALLRPLLLLRRLPGLLVLPRARGAERVLRAVLRRPGPGPGPGRSRSAVVGELARIALVALALGEEVAGSFGPRRSGLLRAAAASSPIRGRLPTRNARVRVRTCARRAATELHVA